MMKKVFLSVVAIFLLLNHVAAQKYLARNGYIGFFSATPMENIEAHNYQASSVLDTESGEMVYSVLIKGFEFEKALMQEHFNEKYLESDKYPKSTFKGRILNIDELDLSKDGIYDVEVEGDLTIKDATNHIKVKGTLERKGDHLIAKTKFPVRVADYNIHIPAMVKDNIAEVVDVNVNVEYKPYKK